MRSAHPFGAVWSQSVADREILGACPASMRAPGDRRPPPHDRYASRARGHGNLILIRSDPVALIRFTDIGPTGSRPSPINVTMREERKAADIRKVGVRPSSEGR